MLDGLSRVGRIIFYFILFYFNELPINKIKIIRVKKDGTNWSHLIYVLLKLKL